MRVSLEYQLRLGHGQRPRAMLELRRRPAPPRQPRRELLDDAVRPMSSEPQSRLTAGNVIVASLRREGRKMPADVAGFELAVAIATRSRNSFTLLPLAEHFGRWVPPSFSVLEWLVTRALALCAMAASPVRR